MGIGGKISKAIKNPSKTVSGIGKKIDVSAGKTFYGNTVGFKNNRIGAKKSNPNSKFAKNEYLFLGNFYENSLIEKIRKRFSEIIEDDDHSVKMAFYEGKYYQRHLKRADLIPDVSKLLNDKLKKILEEYYGGYFKINHVDATRNYGVPEEIVKKTELFSSRYHCDNKRSDYTKLFVHLSDVTEDHGPYQSFSKKRTKELMKMGYKSRRDYNLPNEIMENEKDLFKGIGPIGTSYLTNTELCLHRAGIPKVGLHRDMFKFRIERSDTPMESDWLEHIGNFATLHDMSV